MNTNRLLKIPIIIASLLGMCLAQTVKQNVLYTDMKGKKYDLFSLLEQKKYVYLMMIFND